MRQEEREFLDNSDFFEVDIRARTVRQGHALYPIVDFWDDESNSVSRKNATVVVFEKNGKHWACPIKERTLH